MTEIYFSRVLKAGNCFLVHHFSSVCSVMSNSLWPPWTAARQASLSFSISQSLLKLMSIELLMPSNRLILCHPLLLFPSVFPSIRVFSNESALHIRCPKYWSFSFSISPSKTYSGFISFKIGYLISLLFMGLSRMFSSTTVRKHQFFDAQEKNQPCFPGL